MFGTTVLKLRQEKLRNFKRFNLKIKVKGVCDLAKVSWSNIHC